MPGPSLFYSGHRSPVFHTRPRSAIITTKTDAEVKAEARAKTRSKNAPQPR